MKKYIVPIIFQLIVCQGFLTAQDLRIHVRSFTKDNKKVIVNYTIEPEHLLLGKNERITLMPSIRSADGTKEILLEPFIINGHNRHKADRRAMAFGNSIYPSQAAEAVRLDKKETRSFSFPAEIGYEEWMKGSDLIFTEILTGCNCSNKKNIPYYKAKLQIPEPYTPRFSLAYITPETEPIKQRSESFSASLNYRINDSYIDPGLKGNDSILSNIQQTISGIRNDPNTTITTVIVTGYASPDGSTAHNLLLSEKRAKSSADYLVNKCGIHQEQIQTIRKGEDWDGLLRDISISGHPYQDEILNIINRVGDTDKRKSALKQLKGGAVYTTLLNDYYPLLRRNTYDIQYTVKSLSTGQAKEIIKIKPRQLSLNEMFMVANTFENGSPQFNEVFHLALKYFPDSRLARLNSYTSDIACGSYEEAISGLEAIDTPEAYNNLGVALFYKGDYDKALFYFRKALDRGLPDASHNLSEYSKWLENTDH